jgi:hypothetical protein
VVVVVVVVVVVELSGNQLMSIMARRQVSMLGYCRIREELPGGPPLKNRTASSPGRRTQEASGSGGGVGSQQGCQQPCTTQGIGERTAAGTEQLAISKTTLALFDPMGPVSSDPILP